MTERNRVPYKPLYEQARTRVTTLEDELNTAQIELAQVKAEAQAATAQAQVATAALTTGYGDGYRKGFLDAVTAYDPAVDHE